MTPAAWSFGLALIALAGFGVQLALGWRGGIRASVLVAAVAISALWAGTGLAFALWRTPELWTAWRTLDLLRSMNESDLDPDDSELSYYLAARKKVLEREPLNRRIEALESEVAHLRVVLDQMIKQEGR